MTQHDFSAFGVHPTCSVSIISSGPGDPFDPSELKHEDLTQYVIPGSKFVTSPVNRLPSLPTETIILRTPDAQSCSICFHSNSYFSIEGTGLNITEMVVCGIKVWSNYRMTQWGHKFILSYQDSKKCLFHSILWYYLATNNVFNINKTINRFDNIFCFVLDGVKSRCHKV